MSRDLNLSNHPFLNPRPVKRVTILLWILGVAVAAINVQLYFTHFAGSSESRGRLTELEGSLSAEERKVTLLQGALGEFNIDWQNSRSEFLNAKIAERSFSWSALFDRLGEVLPSDVRLETVSPEFKDDQRKEGAVDNEVELGLRGVAKNYEVLLGLLDEFYAHDRFRDPNLGSWAEQESGLLDFNLTVHYAPAPPEPVVTAELEDQTEAQESTEAAAEAAAESETDPDGVADGGEGDGETPVRVEPAAGEVVSE